MEKELQNEGLEKSKMSKRDSIPSIWTKKSLRKRLEKGPDARAKFVKSQIRNGIAFQIRALRGRNRWSQPKLAKELDTTQNQIYRLENPAKVKPNITSLEKIAAVFDVALIVRFVPFSQLIDWTTGTPRIDKGLSSASLAVPSFSQEMESSSYAEQTGLEVREVPTSSQVIVNVVPTSTDWLPTFDESPLYLQVAKQQLEQFSRQHSHSVNEPFYGEIPVGNFVNAFPQRLDLLQKASVNAYSGIVPNTLNESKFLQPPNLFEIVQKNPNPASHKVPPSGYGQSSAIPLAS